MKLKDLIINIGFLAIGIGATYFFYLKTKIDTLTEDVRFTKEKVERCESEKKMLKDKDENLELQIKKAEIETEYKIKEIELLKKTIDQKDSQLIDLNIVIEEKENKIEKMLYDLKKIIEEGATEEMREKIQSLYSEIEQLNSEKESLKKDKKSLQEDIKVFKKEILELEKEIKIYKDITVPKIKNRADQLQNKLNIANSFQDFINIRADVQNIRIDNKKNILQFDLVFESEDIKFLKQNNNISKFTFSPKVINETKKSVFIPQPNNFTEFSKYKHELTEFITINFPVSNYSFSKYKNGKKGINLSKGDLIKIKVLLDELYEIEIANSSFYLK